MQIVCKEFLPLNNKWNPQIAQILKQTLHQGKHPDGNKHIKYQSPPVVIRGNTHTDTHTQ